MVPSLRSTHPPRLPLLLLLGIFAAALLVAPPAAAQLVPDGPLVDVGGTGLPGFAPGGIALDDQQPRVLMDGEGGFIVFWFEAEKSANQPRLLARRFAPDGTPMWQEREYWDPVDGVEVVGGFSDVAMNPDGDFAIVWIDDELGVMARLFDVCGDPLGPIVEVGEGEAQPDAEVVGLENLQVAVTPDRTMVLAWSQVLQEIGEDGATFEGLVSQRVAADGSFLEPFQRLAADSAIARVDVTAALDGGYGVVFEGATVDPAASYVRFLLFDADNESLITPPLPDDVPDHPSQEGPDLAINSEGHWMVVFTGGGGQGANGVDGSCSGVFGRFYDPEGLLRISDVQVNPNADGCQGMGQVAGLDGGWLAAWLGADREEVFGTDGSENGLYVRAYDGDGLPAGGAVRVLPALAFPSDLAAGGGQAAIAAVMPNAADQARVVVRLLSPAAEAACSDAAEDHLCLQGDRFRVDADWRDPYNTGVGLAFARGIRPDSGALWFFAEPNLELLVKVLDGRPVDGHWWVFYGALSTVEYWVAVTDLETGRQNVYHNPPFVQASVADTGAFEGGAGAGAAAVVAPSVARLPDRPVQELAGPQHVTGELTPIFCGDGPTQLCLQEQQFRVTVEWSDPRSGDSGTAAAVPLTSDTGAFWFFNANNLELMVKVLDGRPVNGHWWVIYAGLSDVEYTITVDWAGGGEAVYLNDPFVLNSGADTTAFED